MASRGGRDLRLMTALTGVLVTLTPPATDESPRLRRGMQGKGQRSRPPWLAALLAVILAMVGMAGGAATVASAAHAPEAAEEAGAAEESTASRRAEARRRRTVGRARSPRLRRRPRIALRSRRSPTLVVPTACAPRRGPPRLSY